VLGCRRRKTSEPGKKGEERRRMKRRKGHRQREGRKQRLLDSRLGCQNSCFFSLHTVYLPSVPEG
jgi:hypothetical protein